MNKRVLFRRVQRLLVLLIIAIALLLIWPFIKAPDLHAFFPTTRFTIPDPPELKLTNINAEQMPKTFLLSIKSKDPQLVVKLQEQGYPAYLHDGKIEIGPYLESFKSQLDLKKISQMTSVAVKIVDNNIQ